MEPFVTIFKFDQFLPSWLRPRCHQAPDTTGGRCNFNCHPWLLPSKRVEVAIALATIGDSPELVTPKLNGGGAICTLGIPWPPIPQFHGRNKQKLRRVCSSEVNVMRRIIWLPWGFFRQKPWEDPNVFAQGSCPQSTFCMGPTVHLSLLNNEREKHEVFIYIIYPCGITLQYVAMTAIFLFQYRIADTDRSGSCQRLNRQELPCLG